MRQSSRVISNLSLTLANGDTGAHIAQFKSGVKEALHTINNIALDGKMNGSDLT
jgi:hypothetical protein